MGTRDNRIRRRIKRFRCHCKLILNVKLSDRQLKIVLLFDYHAPYLDTCLSQEALYFVKLHCINWSPAEFFFSHLLPSGILGVDLIARHQVYYQWQYAYSNIWRCYADPFLSALESINVFKIMFQHAVYKSGNLRGLAVHVCGKMSALASEIKEPVIDAKYRTNNSGKNLKILSVKEKLILFT